MIAPLKHADLAAAAKIHSESFDTAWPMDSLEAHIGTDLCLGIFEPDLQGFIIIKSAADQAEIITLAVSPDGRGAGRAYALVMQSCEQLQTRNLSILFLEVAEDNVAASALYKKCGFIPIGRRPAYYRRAAGRVAALTYRKDL